ncbi:hypothetical protein [Xanthocytophaga agilis]|uniref:Uncharacterized protein n=1 Tax=Xanthocytophaga agilis TaxID=3048010 RepID=A0AAE3R5H1_9BACT|nr:hypothetical protein [Xanthocytophaga agilis]MDJ1501188.1 hypothetical protein [Xanthocytophaga agilis]
MKKILAACLLCCVSVHFLTAQTWNKTPIKEVATIEFPLSTQTVDANGQYAIGGYNDSLSFIVMFAELPADRDPKKEGSDDISVLRSFIDGHLRAEQAKSIRETNFTVNGQAGIEIYHTSPSNPMQRNRSSRYLRAIKYKNYLIGYEVMTFPDLEDNKSIEATRKHFFDSFQLNAIDSATTEIPSSSSKPIAGDSIDAIAYKIGYIAFRLFMVGIIVLIGIFIFRRIRKQ